MKKAYADASVIIETEEIDSEADDDEDHHDEAYAKFFAETTKNNHGSDSLD